MKIFKILIVSYLLIFLGIIGYGLIIEYDIQSGNSLYIEYQVVGSCNYTLPKNYTLVKDSITNEYAIQVRQFTDNNYYVSLDRYFMAEDLVSGYGTSEEAIVFKDSCKAKGFVKKYLEAPRKEEFKRKFIELKK